MDGFSGRDVRRIKRWTPSDGLWHDRLGNNLPQFEWRMSDPVELMINCTLQWSQSVASWRCSCSNLWEAELSYTVNANYRGSITEVFLLKLEFRICIRIIHPPLFNWFLFFDCKENFHSIFCNGNKNKRSPIRSVIIRVITKSDDCAAEVRFVYHDFTTRSLKVFSSNVYWCCWIKRNIEKLSRCSFFQNFASLSFQLEM